MYETDRFSEIDFEVSSPVSTLSFEVGNPPAGTTTYNFGDGLSYDKRTNTLYVNVSNEIIKDSNLPISSIAILKILSSYVKAEEGKVLSDNNFTDKLLEKLEYLTNYIHPSTHPASMISGLEKVATTGKYYDLKGLPDSFPASSHDHTMQEIQGLLEALRDRAYKDHGHNLASYEKDGFLCIDDKRKIDSIEEGANKYVHPEKHDISEIEGLSKVAKSNNYSDLDGIPDSFNPNEHTHEDKADLVRGKIPQEQLPDNLVSTDEEGKIPASTIPDKYVTVEEDGKVSREKLPSNLVSTEENGKLPESVIPDIIPSKLSDLSDDETHRVVTDEEKSKWNAKSEFDGSYNSLKDVPDEFNPTSHEHSEYAKEDDVKASLLKKADIDNVYTKEEIDSKLVGKADTDKVYIKEEIDNKLSLKVEKSDVYTKEEVDSKLSGAYHYKGTKENYSELPTENNELGDTWNILNADPGNNIKAGDNVAWDGEKWDILSGIIDLSAYATKDSLKDKADLVEGKIPKGQIPDSVLFKEEGKGLSTNDYSNEEKQKLEDTKNSLEELQKSFEDHVNTPTKLEAEKVYFTEDLKTTYEIGNVILENGMATIPAKDKNLKDVWDSIFIKEIYPKVSLPSISLIAPIGCSYEVGTEIIPAYEFSFNEGSYSYGPSTNVLVTSWEISDSRGISSDSNFGNFDSLVIEDDTYYTIEAIAYYGEGEIPITNLGNEYPEGKINSGSVETISSPVKGYRNSFYGTLSEKTDMNSDIIRSLTPSRKFLAKGDTFKISIPVGAMRVVIAYPDNIGDISSIKDVNGMNAEISSSFTKQIISVAGVSGYTPINYKVYSLDFANPNDIENNFSVII